MAFISEKKRENIIKKINKSYGFRKFLICIEMALLFGFIIMTFVSIAKWDNGFNWWDQSANKMTTLGWGMFAWAIIMVVFGIIAMILTLTLKSPKKITQQVSHLESSARAGKRNEKNSAANYRDRTLSKKDKK